MLATKPQIISLIQEKLGATEDKSSEILDYLIFYIHKSLDDKNDVDIAALEIIKQANEQNMTEAIIACASS